MQKKESNSIDYFIKLLAEGNSKYVVDELLSSKHEHISKKQLLAIKLRIKDVEKEELMGVISEERKIIERNKINKQLIEIITQNSSEDSSSINAPPHKKHILIALVFLLISSSILFLLIYKNSRSNTSRSIYPIFYNNLESDSLINLVFVSDSLKIRDTFSVPLSKEVSELKRELILHYDVFNLFSIPNYAHNIKWYLNTNQKNIENDSLTLFEAGLKENDLLKINISYKVTASNNGADIAVSVFDEYYELNLIFDRVIFDEELYVRINSEFTPIKKWGLNNVIILYVYNKIENDNYMIDLSVRSKHGVVEKHISCKEGIVYIDF